MVVQLRRLLQLRRLIQLRRRLQLRRRQQPEQQMNPPLHRLRATTITSATVIPVILQRPLPRLDMLLNM
jgi:hypothetical protein